MILPTISFTVDNNSIATAFGVLLCIYNFCMFSGPLIVGLIIDNTAMQHGYFWVSIFFVFVGVCGVSSGIIVVVLNRHHDNDLNAVEMKEEARESLLPDGNKSDSDAKLNHTIQ